ncbi:MAG: hypothetical protein PWQ12_514 [Clostridiales bacterium]|jgi:predicted polyphosphate/ATP-dependent NAD kinase|nr:hypothetical protein [Clostridiales bacterium]
MASIGIIANPASGKDIRRLVSHATVVDNNEKVNILKRIILAAQTHGIMDFYIMPDTYQMGYAVIDSLETRRELKANIHVMDMSITGSMRDTKRAAEEMEALGVGCIIVLGGDGTSRAAAKGIKETPLLPISTGTNNVYPQMIEGTIAGIAAAMVAKMDIPHASCMRDKRIEVYKNGELADIALIDAVLSSSAVVGAKAIWDVDEMDMLFTTRCHPASIGFSSIAGYMRIVRPEEDLGVMLDLKSETHRVLAPIAAGVITELTVGEPKEIALNQTVEMKMDSNGVVALDGEREIIFREGDVLGFKITREGPYRVKVSETLERALEEGIFSK